MRGDEMTVQRAPSDAHTVGFSLLAALERSVMAWWYDMQLHRALL
jgi:hypothetical protein